MTQKKKHPPKEYDCMATVGTKFATVGTMEKRYGRWYILYKLGDGTWGWGDEEDGFPETRGCLAYYRLATTEEIAAHETAVSEAV